MSDKIVQDSQEISSLAQTFADASSSFTDAVNKFNQAPASMNCGLLLSRIQPMYDAARKSTAEYLGNMQKIYNCMSAKLTKAEANMIEAEQKNKELADQLNQKIGGIDGKVMSGGGGFSGGGGGFSGGGLSGGGSPVASPALAPAQQIHLPEPDRPKLPTPDISSHGDTSGGVNMTDNSIHQISIHDNAVSGDGGTSTIHHTAGEANDHQEATGSSGAAGGVGTSGSLGTGAHPGSSRPSGVNIDTNGTGNVNLTGVHEFHEGLAATGPGNGSTSMEGLPGSSDPMWRYLAQRDPLGRTPEQLHDLYMDRDHLDLGSQDDRPDLTVAPVQTSGVTARMRNEGDSSWITL